MRIPTVLKYVGIVLVIDEDTMLILPFRFVSDRWEFSVARDENE